MKTVLATFAILLTTACGGAGGSVSTVSSNPPPPPAPAPLATTPGQTFDSMLNNVRAASGAAPVSYDARLGRAAQRHANDMQQNNFLLHTGSDGSSVGDRVTAEGYTWRTVGENIAQGQQDEEAALRGWVNSPGHQRNNINPAFEDFAIAKAGTGSQQYWVLVLAAER